MLMLVKCMQHKHCNSDFVVRPKTHKWVPKLWAVAWSLPQRPSRLYEHGGADRTVAYWTGSSSRRLNGKFGHQIRLRCPPPLAALVPQSKAMCEQFEDSLPIPFQRYFAVFRDSSSFHRKISSSGQSASNSRATRRQMRGQPLATPPRAHETWRRACPPCRHHRA